MTIEIGIMVGIVGCFVGLAGWLKARDGKIESSGEWKGQVTTMLTSIQDNVTGVGNRLDKLEDGQKNLSRELGEVKASAASCHKRVDELIEKGE